MSPTHDPTTAHAAQLYRDLMLVIRYRLDLIATLEHAEGEAFARAEAAAFQGRKVIEGIAFACLVATDHGLKHVPNDARGQWNAEKIFRRLAKKTINTFPSPSIIRQATDKEYAQHGVRITVEGQPDRRISTENLISIYKSLHPWLHELNPYRSDDRQSYSRQHGAKLWSDLSALNRFIERHAITVKGSGFFCVLRDKTDLATKLLSVDKMSEV